MKKAVLFLGLIVVTPDVAQALDKETQFEIRRLEQRIGRMHEGHQKMVQDIRSLEKAARNLSASQQLIEDKIDQLTDTIVKVQNVDVANLRAGQKGIYDQLPLFTWGEDTESCEDINTKHQQINTVKSDDGLRTLRFLCFDGKAIHLGTEFHLAPQ